MIFKVPSNENYSMVLFILFTDFFGVGEGGMEGCGGGGKKEL